MNKEIKTSKAAPPFSNYAQAIEVPANARCIQISGQVGITLEGELPEESENQNELAWQHIFAILEEAGMEKTDIVEVWSIVRDHSEVAQCRSVRDRVMNGHCFASTMLVCSLANPDWKVEIAVKACKSD